MSEKDPNVQSDFMIEKIKERPVNKGKLIRRMLLTAAMAVIFGLVACFTFLALEPVLSGWMNPEKDLPKIYFPEETEEMLPEEMLLENIPDTSLTGNSGIEADPSEQGTETGEVELEEEQIQKILSEINLSVVNYRQMYSALSEYTKTLQKSMVTLTGVTSRTDWLNDVNESTNRASGIIIYNNSVDLFILTD